MREVSVWELGKRSKLGKTPLQDAFLYLPNSMITCIDNMITIQDPFFVRVFSARAGTLLIPLDLCRSRSRRIFRNCV